MTWINWPYGTGTLIKTHHASLASLRQAQLSFGIRESESIPMRMWNVARKAGRAVLLLRNPYEAILSWVNHIDNKDSLSTKKMDKAKLLVRPYPTRFSNAVKFSEMVVIFQHIKKDKNVCTIPSSSSYLQLFMESEKFHQFFAAELSMWRELALDYISLSTDLYVIHFEDLQTNYIKEIERINKFLKVPRGRYERGARARNSQNFEKKKVKHRQFHSKTVELYVLFSIICTQWQEQPVRMPIYVPISSYAFYLFSTIPQIFIIYLDKFVTTHSSVTETYLKAASTHPIC